VELKTKDTCLICNTVFYEEDVEDKNGYVRCPNCGSDTIQPFGFNIYEDEDDSELI